MHKSIHLGSHAVFNFCLSNNKNWFIQQHPDMEIRKNNLSHTAFTKAKFRNVRKLKIGLILTMKFCIFITYMDQNKSQLEIWQL